MEDLKATVVAKWISILAGSKSSTITIDKRNGNQVEYMSGAIENPGINPVIVDILEGTPPAFRNRQSKYHMLQL